jgi:acyl-CoA synthetase (AMP-forming)/AMP-acid ligase II/pimeloyl-ACP methyl ester carboxylesterase
VTSEPARLPPAGLDGLDPSWSRLVTVDSIEGGRTFHVLDNGVENPTHTLLCVHGNPSWSYLWRHVLAAAPADLRVVAIDHLDMGFSERTGQFRRLATRIDDLCALTDAMELAGPVVTVAHDWGGPISLGWAARHRERLDGVVLLNTAVHQPEGSPAPRVIRAVRTRGVLGRATVDSTAFIRGAFEISEVKPPRSVRDGYLAPYASADRRKAIGQFVEDIPLDPSHPSATALDDVAASLEELADTPALLIWGAADKVFGDLYLHDLEARLPHADVHRHPTAGHFVSEDVDAAAAIMDWVGVLDRPPADELQVDHLDSLADSLADPSIAELAAVMEMGESFDSIDFGPLAERIEQTARGLLATGVQPGDRVALMVPPSIDLVVALYACWRMRAVAVLVDSGLGPKGMSAAMRSAAPDHLIGIPKALAAARTLGWPGRPISTVPLSKVQQRVLGTSIDLPSIRSELATPLPEPTIDDPAAVVFTSGSTGPSKGVRYTHGRIDAQKRAIMELFGITSDDRLVAAFAPFALYGPAMGITSVVPDMDVTAPATLTAVALADAAVAADATMVFASPSALTNVLRTKDELSASHRMAFANVRLVMSAGAPVRPSLLHEVGELFPNAKIHTPYGMTEMLPVASIERHDIAAATGGDGVCVGHPLAGVEVRIRPLGAEPGDTVATPGIVGEVVVRAAHARNGYDRLWHTTYKANQPAGWHATGDVGHLDDEGRLWIGGRLGHVIDSPSGPVTPVAIEQRLEDLPGVAMAAVVGVGPSGVQQIVAVVQVDDIGKSPRLAGLDRIDAARAAVDHDLVAVFEVPALPVDRRHNAKIDRTAVAEWAATALAGGKLGSL